MSVERRLLAASDALARRLGISRAALVERGLKAVIGSGGVVLDFGDINQSCFTLAGPGQRLSGVSR